MSRDYRKLKIFGLADEAVLAVYRLSRRFPLEERFGLQTQVRRAAVSVPANIVEGSARRSTTEYLNFLNIASGSATEARYLLGLSRRLGYLAEESVASLEEKYQAITAGIQALMSTLEALEREAKRALPRRPGPKS